VNIFLNDSHQLRSGWKFATYVVFFLLIWVATATALTLAVASARTDLLENQLVLFALTEIALLVPAVVAMLLIIRFVDHRPLKTFGVGFLPYWRQHLVLGLGIAAAMLVILVTACYLLGFVSMRWTAGQVSPLILLATFAFLALAAAVEELVFRGLPLQLLIDGVGEWPAIIAMSVLFGALHLDNPNATWLGMLNTVLAGILLSLAYIRTRSLWLPYGIHLGWNAGLGFVLGFPLSGIDLASIWTTGIAGSDLILGGGYGPEGGMLATFLFGAAAVVVNKMR
jgi:membrane protease YdiL (CAAX protease family)